MTTTEYGIFNDEGCVEAGYYSADEAKKDLETTYADEPFCTISEICPDHDEQPRETCEECMSEDDDA